MRSKYAAIKVLLNLRCFLSYLSFQDVFSSNKNKVHNKPLLVVLLLFIITDKII